MTFRRTALRAVALALVGLLGLTGLTGLIGLTGSPAQAADPPVPTVSGTARYGETLVASPGDWEDGVTLAYQWLREGAPIAAATGTSYAVVVGDVGSRLSVRVTGSRLGFETGTVSSEPTEPVAPATLAAGTVRIAGVARVGRTLYARPSGFDTGSAGTFRWYVGSRLVGHGTELRLTRDLTRRRIVLQLTVTKAGYAPATVTSAPTPKVKRKPEKHRHHHGHGK